MHPIDDNEHVGGYGKSEQWDMANTDLLQEQYVWEFRNLPPWLTPHKDLVSGEHDGILYGTPPTTGEWIAEARVHNLEDEYGVFSDWHPIQLSVRPDRRVPAHQEPSLRSECRSPTSSKERVHARSQGRRPGSISQPVPNGCVVMGRAPISGEYYNFSMPNFRETGYPNTPIVFSGKVVGAYNFDALPEGAGIAGLAWHQVEKYPTRRPNPLS